MMKVPGPVKQLQVQKTYKIAKQYHGNGNATDGFWANIFKFL